MVGCRKKRKDDWLGTLLQSEFFGSCVLHQEFRKNEKNTFCIDCNLGFCRHCSTSHGLHSRLQICKYSYHDVVRLHDVGKFLDCSNIQTYKINGEKAVHLNPRPQSKDTKPSTKSKFGGTCEACGRFIQDIPNSFCSIACKVSVMPINLVDHNQSFVTASIRQCEDLSPKEKHSMETNTSEVESSISMAESSEKIKAWLDSSLKPRKLFHKRKGTPQRSPLC